MRAGIPEDLAAWVALGAALLTVATGSRWLSKGRERVLIVLAAIAAGALSAGYVVAYLRGGPRIIDATSYYLEARTFATGHFTFDLGEPRASTIGRFLVSPVDDATRATPIFPPGYPALLALGFLVHAPLAVGPLLAALLVVATWALAREVTPDPHAPRIAAVLSVVCAALRYHTADTMSHGLAALAFTSALGFAFAAIGAAKRGETRPAAIFASLAGLAAGALAATRPVSSLALALTALTLIRALPFRATLRLFAFAALGALPGLVLLLLHQHAATGAWFASSQRLYYEVSDGPPGCFRYGFGEGIGCALEHEDFVRAHLRDGYGFVAALGTTGRRLLLHLVDAGNAEPMFLLVLAGIFGARKNAFSRALSLGVVFQVAVYAPFYFDGNYPGGGARFFADVLPLEHVLMALGALAVADRAAHPQLRESLAALPVGLALLGFAFRASFEHAALRDREGGRPMFDSAVLERAGVDRGLVFLDTDHGFDLAFDPSRKGALDFVRARPAFDELAWRSRGEPPAYRYRYDLRNGVASVEPFYPTRKPLTEIGPR